MSILVWAVVGFASGLMANLVTRRYGPLEDVIVGIAGSIVAGWVFSVLTGAPVTHFGISDVVAALAGSLLFIALARGLTGGHPAI